MDFGRILSFDYLFSIHHIGFTPEALKSLVTLFVALLVVSAALRLVGLKRPTPHDRKLLQKMANLFLGIGLLGFLFIFFRQVDAAFLAMPFWLLALLLAALVWLVRIWRWGVKVYPAKKEQWAKERERKKYLS